MRHTLSEKLLRALRFLMYVVIVGTPLFYIRKSVYPYTFSKTIFFQAAVELLFALYLALAIIAPRYRPKWTPFTVALALFAGTLLAATFLGTDPGRSFWSTQERTFGVFTVLHALSLALVASSLGRALPWARLAAASFGTSGILSILGLMQLKNPNLLMLEDIGGRPGSTFGNPTFFAGYLVIHLFLLYYCLIRGKSEMFAGKHPRPWHRWFFISVGALDLLALFATQTRGDILALGAGLFTLALLHGIHPPQSARRLLKSRWLYIGIAAAVVGSGILFWTTRTHALWGHIPGIRRFRDISFTSISYQPRLFAYRAAWKGFLEKPWTGMGPENFNIVFNKYYDPKALELGYLETRFDKPHNAALEYLVTGGIPLAASYLFVLAAFAYELWRLKDPRFRVAGSAIFIAYLVRHLFIFETLGPFFIFFLLAAAVDVRYREERRGEAGEPAERLAPRAQKMIIIALACAAGIAAYTANVRTMQAAYNQYWGFMRFAQSRPAEGLAHFKRAIAVRQPYRWNFVRDYAAVVAETHFYNHGVLPKEEIMAAIREMERVKDERPDDAYHRYMLVDLYNEVSDLDPDYFLPRAEAEAEAALKLSPNRQQVYFSLAKTKHLQGKKKEAIELIKKALALSDRVPDGHFYYGLLAFSDGDLELGMREIKIALEQGRRWRNYYEPQVVGNFFAQAGNFEGAIGFYEEAMRMKPDNLETRLKLGVAYAASGNKVRAREEILFAMQKMDLRNLPNYAELAPILADLGL